MSSVMQQSSFVVMSDFNISTLLSEETTPSDAIPLEVDPVTPEMSMHVLKAAVCVWISFSMLGLATNFINIVTFWRLKLNDSSTVLLFFLAISDFGVCFFEFVGAFASTVEVVTVENNIKLFLPPDFISAYMTGLKRIFSDTTVFITTFLAVQRCICVVLPFEVKNLFNVRRAYCFLVVCILYNVTSNSLFIWSFPLMPYTFRETNFTQLMVYVRPGAEPIIVFSEVAQTIVMNAVCPVLTLICLCIMGFALMKSERFKNIAKTPGSSAAADKDGEKQQEKKVSKERLALMQVTLITFIFVITNIPYLPHAIATFLFPEYFRLKAYDKLYRVILWLLLTGELINSSLNFFVYYKFNSKFREMMPFGKKQKEST